MPRRNRPGRRAVRRAGLADQLELGEPDLAIVRAARRHRNAEPADDAVDRAVGHPHLDQTALVQRRGVGVVIVGAAGLDHHHDLRAGHADHPPDLMLLL